MARPKGTNIVNDLINASSTIDEKDENKTNERNENKIDEKEKFKKLLVFDNDMKGILEKEAKKRRMTVAGFIKFCIVQELDKQKDDKKNGE